MPQSVPNRWQGLVLGTIGGLAGTLAMGWYFRATSALMQDAQEQQDDSVEDAPGALDDVALIGPFYEEGEGSTETVGRLAYQLVTGRNPRAKETKTMLSELTHWSFGASMGGLYGASRSDADAPDVLGGLAFGSGVWLFASEISLPLLGFAPGPTAQPAAKHALEFGAHLVYGATTAATTHALRWLVD
jgi:hypothetical protein